MKGLILSQARQLLLLVSAFVVLAFASVTSAGAATVVNGDFTAGNLNGWQVVDQPGGSGTWITYNSTLTPLSNQTIAAPPSGVAAIADMTGKSSTLMYQDIALEANLAHQLELDLLADNRSGSWIVPAPLSFTADPMQFVRIDVVKPSAAPDAAAASDILQTLFAPVAGDPLVIGWQRLSVDLSAFAGQTVRLRFIDADTQNFLFFGIDNVSITSKDVTAAKIEAFKTAKSKFRSKGRGAGSDVTFVSDEAGTGTVSVLRSSKGKRSGNNCVKPSKKLAKKRNCTRWVKLRGSISYTAVAGANKFKFSGKLRGKSLPPGKYRLQMVLNSLAGLDTTVTSNNFKIIK